MRSPSLFTGMNSSVLMLGRGSIDLRKSSVRPTAVGDVQNAEVALVDDLGEVAELFDDGRWVSD